MKKLIILAFVMLTTTVSFSQGKLYAYLLETGTWNSYTEKWNYNRIVNVSLDITVAKTYISVNDQAGTFLSINSYEGEDVGTTTDGVRYKTAKWACTDEIRRNCIFSMVEYSDGTYMLIVMYNNVSYRYYVRTTKLSNY